MKNLVITAALLASLGSAHAGPSIVVDGSFEQQAQASGTWGVYQTLPGWTTFAGAGIELRNSVAGTASSGKNFVELDSHRNSGMSQTLTTLAGSFYTLSFDYSAREGIAAASNGIEVLWNGASVATLTADGTGFSGSNWNLYSYNLLGTGSDVLGFRSVGTNDGFGGSLDSVAVTTAVPEPATWAMTLAGFALVGFWLRRRRSNR
ncbi:MAG: PEPxxWA-CTERM sorting domain-containing protein [Rhizobiales bacterium]|nr:PEPxxWA-CTERM sorting domain-containing protein [Rhizobacter sp.]